MHNKKQHNPWLWIPMLSAAEEIPFVVVTYVALLMFVQFGVGFGMASLYVSLLAVPWILKSFVRSKVRSAGYFKFRIHVAQGLIFLMMMLIEITINHWHCNTLLLFAILFIMSGLCAWHELLSKMYYERMLYPREQILFHTTKVLATQTTMVLTYGVLIIIVGFLEVFFRSISKAWAMESYLVAGGFFFFVMSNLALLKNPRICNSYRYESMARTVKAEIHIIERIRRKAGSKRVIFVLFFLLLPQALMFNSRVFYLLTPVDAGGLGCTIHEVGFAQGTIGVLAFSFGIVIGRRLVRAYDHRIFWLMAVSIVLSPLCYMTMTLHPHYDDMLALCIMTLLAQFFFGLGLNICYFFVRFISGERYRNTINYLYVPLVAAALFVPMMASGWMCQWLGFRTFFIIDAASALLPLVLLPALGIKQLLTYEDR